MKSCYFGKWADDPKGERANLVWADQRNDLLAGRTPRAVRGGLTVRDRCNHFLTAKDTKWGLHRPDGNGSYASGINDSGPVAGSSQTS